MFQKLLVAFVVLNMLLVIPSRAEQPCMCASDRDGRVTVLATRGHVTFPGSFGMESAVAGTVIDINDQLAVASRSRADIRFGYACEWTVPENTTVRLFREDKDRVCLRVVRDDPFTIAPATLAIDVNGDGNDDNLLMALLLGAAAVGGSAALLSGGGGNTVSR